MAQDIEDIDSDFLEEMIAYETKHDICIMVGDPNVNYRTKEEGRRHTAVITSRYNIKKCQSGNFK